MAFRYSLKTGIASALVVLGLWAPLTVYGAGNSNASPLANPVANVPAQKPPDFVPPGDRDDARAARALGLAVGKNTDYTPVLVAVNASGKQVTSAFHTVADQKKATGVGLKIRSWSAKMMANPLYDQAPRQVQELVVASKKYSSALLNMRTQALAPEVDNVRAALVNYVRSHDSPKVALSNINIQIVLLSMAWLKGLTSKEVTNAEQEIKEKGLAATWDKKPETAAAN